MLLDANPFYVLGVSTRDGRLVIVERADGMSLTLDQALCARCSSELINPRQRLQCEVAWLPGVSPGQARLSAEAAVKGSRTDLLPSPLAQTNVLVTMLAHQRVVDIARLPADILAIAQSWDRVETEEVRALVNGDRRGAGFALADDSREVERALHARMDAICAALAKSLRGLPEAARVQALTQALDRGTVSGTAPGPMLLHAVMDAMSPDLREALDREGSKVTDALEMVRKAAATGRDAPLQGAIFALGALLREWDRYAQPLQLSAKSRGQDHQASRDVAHEIRELAVFLHNEHSATTAAQRITELLQEVFAEVPKIVERAEEDLATLGDLIGRREAARAQQAAVQSMEPLTPVSTTQTTDGFGRRFVGWAIAAGVWMLLSSIGDKPSKPYSSPEPTSPGSSSAVQSLLQLPPTPPAADDPNRRASDYSAGEPDWIRAGRIDIQLSESELSQLEAQLEASKNEVEQLERRVKSYDVLATDGALPSGVFEDYQRDLRRYRTQIELHNALVDEYQAKWSTYESDLAAFNDRIDRYNQSR